MAEVLLNSPSPPPHVRTPQTPKFGAFGDSWEPYLPRKSARIANQTPSPQSSAVASRQNPSITVGKSSDISTPGGSPQKKKRAPAMDTVTRAPRVASLAAEGSSSAPTSAPQSRPKNITTSAMLPTPSKTPRKQPDEKLEAGVRAVARNLFASESSTSGEAASPRKRKAKTYTGLSLESFRAEEVEEDIAIFTDTRDRLPEVDDSAENPFYSNAESQQPTTTRRSTRVKKVLVPGVGRIPVEEAVQRSDGVVYVFRGKSFWKPREDGRCNEDEEDDAIKENNVNGSTLTKAQAQSSVSIERSGSPPRRVTRSSIKPRLLFPAQEKPQPSHETDEEEAPTDIEDNVDPVDAKPEEQQSETPQESEEKSTPDTPTAPRFAPASPPSTSRATRSKKLVAEETPAKRTGRRSPFDSWRRTKAGTPHGHKREAEGSLPSEAASKRHRA